MVCLAFSYCTCMYKSVRFPCYLRNLKGVVSFSGPAARRHSGLSLCRGSAVRSPVQSFTTRLKRHLYTMQLSDTQMAPLLTPELRQLADLFERHGFALRIAGGAVRDILAGGVPHDLDFATTATPDQMKSLFEAEEIRMINANGERHGTITARINDKENFEVTTLRIDVVTDGRRAEVKFTTDWELDAGRRDLTVNSMFLGLDGVVYDYHGGCADVADRVVRFVGDPATRIEEDYLRILRYFRFYGRIAASPDQHAPEVLEAIRQRVHGLERVSGERIWMELRKIMSGNYRCELMLRMIDVGVGMFMGLPAAPDITQFRLVCSRGCDLQPNPITLLAALLTSEDHMWQLHGKLKLSAFERDLGLFLIGSRHLLEGDEASQMRLYRRLCIEYAGPRKNAKPFVCELLKYAGRGELVAELEAWELPSMPVGGGDLRKEVGLPPSKHMSRILGRLKQHWLDSDLQSSKKELLAHIPAVMDELGIERPKS